MCPGLGGRGLRGGVFSGGGREAAKWRPLVQFLPGPNCPPQRSVCPAAGSAVHVMELFTLILTQSLHRCRVRSLSPFSGNDASAESSGARNNGPALRRRPGGSAEGQRLSQALRGTSALFCDPGKSPPFAALAIPRKKIK